MDEHQVNLERLVTARTEQLRVAVTLLQELADAIRPLRPELAQKATDALSNGLTQ